MAIAGIHLILTSLVSLRDTCAIFSTARTLFPPSFKSAWKSGEAWTEAVLGEGGKFYGGSVLTYLHAAGIESGYGFFAPNVPDNYKMIFDFEFPDGHHESDIPVVSSETAGLRLAGFMDQLADTAYAPLQEAMVRVVSASAVARHIGATKARVAVGVARLPNPTEYGRGERESYDPFLVFDFTFPERENRQ